MKSDKSEKPSGDSAEKKSGSPATGSAPRRRLFHPRRQKGEGEVDSALLKIKEIEKELEQKSSPEDKHATGDLNTPPSKSVSSHASSQETAVGRERKSAPPPPPSGDSGRAKQHFQTGGAVSPIAPKSLAKFRNPAAVAQQARANIPYSREPHEDIHRNVRLYDWGKTAKFSADQKKFLEKIFRLFEDYVTTKLAPLLQTRIAIEYESVRIKVYGDFIQNLYEPVTLISLKMESDDKALLTVDFPLSFAFIDRCLGGRGESLDITRHLTDIETAVLEKVADKLVDSYQEAWKEITDVKPTFLEMQFNPQTMHIVKPSDIIACVSFVVRMGQEHGTVQIAIPFEYLKNVLPRANFEEFMLTKTSASKVSPSVAPLFAKNLEQARVPVSVELGCMEILFQELANLEMNDSIMLNQDISNPLKVKINEKTKFLGRPGIKNNKIAIQITKVLQEGDEEFEE